MSAQGGGQDQLTQARPQGAPGYVLVVDDNLINSVLLTRHLAQHGHRTASASTGQEALDKLKAESFDLVLLDVDMPGMTGHAVLEVMKADPNFRDIPVIMVTGVDELQSVVRCIQQGAEDYLTKPFNPVLLQARIKACLDKKRLRDGERRQTRELELALQQLRATQDQLIVKEKLAELGALTAGIAHEIKNPLNFVMNFSQLSGQLLEELRAALKEKNTAEITDLLDVLGQNLARIREHGARADAIVRDMLLQSRGHSAERQPTDLNALVSQYVHLAYQGLRAQDASFNIAIEEEYDPAVGQVSVMPQELSRVIVNIAGNACYAAHEKKKTAPASFAPTLRVWTKNLGRQVEIHFRDNGPGIAAAIREKIFHPFFTTKPPGTGTGLGLSMSHDIVVRGHRGEVRLETEEGSYAEFIIRLPRGGETAS
jgi:signal transduction histidine kinase